ncbi:hypothetical protein AgCh_023326 [Apium graveolens]
MVDGQLQVSMHGRRALKHSEEARPIAEERVRNSLIEFFPMVSFRARPKKDGVRGQRPPEMNDNTKLYICLEAKKHNNGEELHQHVYLIYSLKLNDLTRKLSDSPGLTKETSLEAYPSMGCGFYQSKIVFAGGQVQETVDELAEQSVHNVLITFDTKSKQLSSDSFPSLLRRKFKPLVFQLHDNLYVMDTVKARLSTIILKNNNGTSSANQIIKGFDGACVHVCTFQILKPGNSKVFEFLSHYDVML